MVAVSVRVRAWRVLAKGGHLVGYRHLNPGTGNEDPVVRKVRLAPGEDAIGVYENPPETGGQGFVVTSGGLHILLPQGEISVPYDSIAHVFGPTAKDAVSPVIRIGLDDGTVLDLAVLGRRTGTFDVFEVLRFLNRVLDDRKRP